MYHSVIITLCINFFAEYQLNTQATGETCKERKLGVFDTKSTERAGGFFTSCQSQLWHVVGNY